MVNISITNERIKSLEKLTKFSEMFYHFGILFGEFLLGCVCLTWMISSKLANSLWNSLTSNVIALFKIIFHKKVQEEQFQQNIEIPSKGPESL